MLPLLLKLYVGRLKEAGMPLHARVESEIFHKRLAIEEGAVFEGQSRLRDEPMNAAVIDLQAMAAGMKSAEMAIGKSA